MSLTIDGSAGVTFPDASVQPVAGQRIVVATAQATTSGTSIDFTGIPSWVKRITVMLNGVSTNGSSIVRLQIGAGSIDTSGYAGSKYGLSPTNTVFGSLWTTSGIEIVDANLYSAVVTLAGLVTLTLLGSNTWVVAGNTVNTTLGNGGTVTAGTKTLSGSLDRVRLTTVNGTDVFDAGSINIMYEG